MRLATSSRRSPRLFTRSRASSAFPSRKSKWYSPVPRSSPEISRGPGSGPGRVAPIGVILPKWVLHLQFLGVRQHRGGQGVQRLHAHGFQFADEPLGRLPVLPEQILLVGLQLLLPLGSAGLDLFAVATPVEARRQCIACTPCGQGRTVAEGRCLCISSGVDGTPGPLQWGSEDAARC